jgi:hypothetical protein
MDKSIFICIISSVIFFISTSIAIIVQFREENYVATCNPPNCYIGNATVESTNIDGNAWCANTGKFPIGVWYPCVNYNVKLYYNNSQGVSIISQLWMVSTDFPNHDIYPDTKNWTKFDWQKELNWVQSNFPSQSIWMCKMFKDTPVWEAFLISETSNLSFKQKTTIVSGSIALVSGLIFIISALVAKNGAKINQEIQYTEIV